jgi:hypothetical protein
MHNRIVVKWQCLKVWEQPSLDYDVWLLQCNVLYWKVSELLVHKCFNGQIRAFLNMLMRVSISVLNPHYGHDSDLRTTKKARYVWIYTFQPALIYDSFVKALVQSIYLPSIL